MDNQFNEAVDESVNELKYQVNNANKAVQGFDPSDLIDNINNNLIPGLTKGLVALSNIASKEEQAVQDLTAHGIEYAVDVTKKVAPHIVSLYHSIYTAMGTYTKRMNETLTSQEVVEEKALLLDNAKHVLWKHPFQSMKLKQAGDHIEAFMDGLSKFAPEQAKSEAS